MKKFLILLVLLGGNDPAEIIKINKLKAAAEKAFAAGEYDLAAKKYSTLYDSMNIVEPEIALNLAHSYYRMGDSTNARTKYQEVTQSANNKLKSIAHQQLGVMSKNPQTLQQSLAHLKSAIKANPTNEDARYDYELVKKLLDEQQKQNQDQKNKDNKENQDQEDQENKDNKEKQDQENKDKQEQNQDQQDKESEKQEGEKGEQKKKDQQEQQDSEQKEDEKQKDDMDMNTKKKLEEMNISEEKARMILEAMKNKEVQYIQQQKRKATKRPESRKPDW